MNTKSRALLAAALVLVTGLARAQSVGFIVKPATVTYNVFNGITGNPAGGFIIDPTLQLNSAQIGYLAGRALITVGLGYATASNVSTRTSGSDSTKKTDEVAYGGLLPELGVKVFFSDPPGEASGGGSGSEVRTYLTGGVFYQILSASITHGGQHDTASERFFYDYIGKTPGAEIAFGAEYGFSPNFAIGGEFGLRGVWQFKNSGASLSGNSSRLGWGSTYAGLSLNFYF